MTSLFLNHGTFWIKCSQTCQKHTQSLIQQFMKHFLLTILAIFPLLRSCWTAYACSTLSMETALTITTLSFSLRRGEAQRTDTLESFWSRQGNLIRITNNLTRLPITEQNLTVVGLLPGRLSAHPRWQWRSRHSENEGYPDLLIWLSRSQTLVPANTETNRF